jgi:hypothetical protein
MVWRWCSASSAPIFKKSLYLPMFDIIKLVGNNN